MLHGYPTRRRPCRGRTIDLWTSECCLLPTTCVTLQVQRAVCPLSGQPQDRLQMGRALSSARERKASKRAARRPLGHPAQLPYAMRQSIIELRGSRRTELGPKKIQARLRERYPGSATALADNNLQRSEAGGLDCPLGAAPACGARRSHRNSIKAPNGLWSADFKGQFLTERRTLVLSIDRDGSRSRYVLGCQGLAGTRGVPTRAVFERLFRQYGLPERVRTDNGVPFASPALQACRGLSIWWIRLGIVPERIEPRAPAAERATRAHASHAQTCRHATACDQPARPAKTLRCVLPSLQRRASARGARATHASECVYRFTASLIRIACLN